MYPKIASGYIRGRSQNGPGRDVPEENIHSRAVEPIAARDAARAVPQDRRVDYIGKRGQHLGTVDAPDEKNKRGATQIAGRTTIEMTRKRLSPNPEVLRILRVALDDKGFVGIRWKS
jgi:hypothetical protein